MYTIALSGPAKTLAKAEVALETARIPVLPVGGPCPCGGHDGKGCHHVNHLGGPAGHHALMDWGSKFPGDTDAWLTVEHDDIDEAVAAVAKAKGWRLRVHYPTPDAPKQTGEQVLTATLAEMRAEIAELKAKVA